MSDAKTIAAYDAQTEAYVSLTQTETPDRSLLDFMDRLEAGARVLDLGCGPAQASAVMRDRGLLVDPVDASSQMVRLANETYDIGARQAGFADVTEVAAYEGIWANYSLLHAAPEELPGLLANLNHALVAGGVFHIGMKLGDSSARDKLGRLYAYYSEAELTLLLQDADFEIVQTVTGEALGLAGDVEPWIMLTGLKRSDTA